MRPDPFWHSFLGEGEGLWAGTLTPKTRLDLSAPVDVYADWIDACDAVAKDDEPAKAGERDPRGIQTGSSPGPAEQGQQLNIGEEADVDEY